MNKQGQLINGKVVGGIEWTKTVLPDGTERQGYTWNPVAGCFHGCKWAMPDGSIARCYAMEGAENKRMREHYPEGFEHHYWHPDRLDEPLKVRVSSKIFLDSMSDLMGRWVPDEQIDKVIDVCRQAHWHIFQLLTKNAPRLKKLIIEGIPPNLWVGVSSTPDFMMGQQLSTIQQERYMHKALSTLADLGDNRIVWMSFEPLSWDVSEIVKQYPGVLKWAVIGAASNGTKKYQPDPDHVQRLLDVLDAQGVNCFFKGNLEWSPWREYFPLVHVRQPALFEMA